MKRFLFVFLVLFFIPCFNAYSQMAVLDATLNSIMVNSGIAQGIYYAQQLADNISQITNTITQIKHMEEAAKRSIQNLESIKDIGSWDDFMDFYNRQLYLERQTAQIWDNTTVTIGKKQYHITDIENIKYGAKDAYADYWAKEFTPEQEREMWMTMGLTPANYAYVTPFREKAKELTKEGFTAAKMQNEWYVRQMERNKEIRDKLAADQHKATEDKLGSKEITMMILETLLDTNKVMNDMAMAQAKEAEKKAVQDMLNNAPNDKPPIADWNKYAFEMIK